MKTKEEVDSELRWFRSAGIMLVLVGILMVVLFFVRFEPLMLASGVSILLIGMLYYEIFEIRELLHGRNALKMKGGKE